jgi:lysine decarboxylase
VDSRMPLLEKLREHVNTHPVSFHVPGHKGNAEVMHACPASWGGLLKYDLTELPGLDNLHCPAGVIKDARRLAAKAYGADDTYFLVNGSTAGVLASMLAAARPGDTVIVDRGCHSSVFSGLVLGRQKPVYVQRTVDPETGIPLSIAPEEVERALRENKGVKAVIITHPTYYGVCSDVRAIAEVSHKKGALLIADEAHGAHLKFCGLLPESALDLGADIVVQSAHKTLPAMTQGSWLHVKGGRVDKERLERMLGMVQTTSPSYVIMASLDNARFVMEKEGARRLEEVLEYAEDARVRINGLDNGLYCPDREYFRARGCFDFDGTKLIINCAGAGLNGHRLDRLLREGYKVYGELFDMTNWLGIVTAASTREDLDRLVEGCGSIKPEGTGKVLLPRLDYLPPKAGIDPWEVMERPSVWVELDHAEGRTACSGVIPYPPGIPLLCPGERLDTGVIERIRQYREFNITIKGLKGGRVEVVE